jgi:putative glutamine amidotransferase
MRPVIGLTAYAESARWAAWDAPATLLPLAYAEQVAAAGGIPVLLPPVPGIAGAVGRLDGLVLTGGGDIDPAAYGAEPHPLTSRVSEQRDRAELDALAAVLAVGLPVLGICRGLQILNVARGGTLHQHLPDVPGLDGLAAHTPELGRYGSHPVRIAPGSRLAEVLGRGAEGAVERAVPTSHHQAIDRLGDGLTATAWAADGVIEAVELGRVTPGQHPFVLAVQWHPEVGQDPSLFRALVAAATSSASSPRMEPRPRIPRIQPSSIR